jgi:hypothetical protein
MTALTVASIISKLLQAQWSLSSPAATDIIWTDTKPDTMQLAQWTKNVEISVYNPANPNTTRMLTRELWEMTENVYVDIYVRVTGTVDVAAATREAIRQECYRIVHVNQTSIQGQKTVDIIREPHKLESPEIARLCLQLACVSWDIRA